MKYTSLLKKFLIVALVLAGNNIFSQNLNIPTLPAGDSIIVVSSVTINSVFTNNPPRLAKQHTISGANFSNVVSDDPETAEANDTTFTPVIMGPVPVILSKITAFHKSNGIQVEWTIQQEINVNKFEIEKSADGRYFSRIGTVVSNGNSNVVTVYGLLDANPYTGLNFYRIKIIDISGETSYSPVVKISTQARDTEITIYPNPVLYGTFAFSVDNLKKGNYTISIFNKAGQEVSRKFLNHTGGSVIEYITLPVTFPSGIFQIRFMGEGISITKKLIKN